MSVETAVWNSKVTLASDVAHSTELASLSHLVPLVKVNSAEFAHEFSLNWRLLGAVGASSSNVIPELEITNPASLWFELPLAFESVQPYKVLAKLSAVLVTVMSAVVPVPVVPLTHVPAQLVLQTLKS